MKGIRENFWKYFIRKANKAFAYLKNLNEYRTNKSWILQII